MGSVKSSPFLLTLKIKIMPSMSYCKFENTSKDLALCLKAIWLGDFSHLSEYEIEGLQNILKYSKEIVECEDDINYAVQLANDETVR